MELREREWEEMFQKDGNLLIKKSCDIIGIETDRWNTSCSLITKFCMFFLDFGMLCVFL